MVRASFDIRLNFHLLAPFRVLLCLLPLTLAAASLQIRFGFRGLLFS
jgi:hypothetical protein